MATKTLGSGYIINYDESLKFRQYPSDEPIEADESIRRRAEMVREMRRTGIVRPKLKPAKAPRFTDRYNQR